MSASVEKLVRSEKNPDSFYLTLTDGRKMTVGLSIVAEHGLYTGRELAEDELSRLADAAAEYGAKLRALRMAAARPLSRGELTDRLVRKGETREKAEKAADYLEKIGALNDAEYADMIVRHYTALGYGRERIRSELYRRRVPREYWEEALETAPDPAGTIDAVIERRLRGRTPDAAELRKLAGALARRGFSWQDIKEALARYGAGPEEDFYDI